MGVIANQKFQKGGVLQGASHANGGIPFSVGGQVGFEAEGGEAIINKRSTALFKDELSEINSYNGYGKTFALGGMTPVASSASGLTTELMDRMVERTIQGITSIPVTVLENDITMTQNKARVIDTAGDA